MVFDKDKFISQATAGGMAESQAAFLADQMDLRAVAPEDLHALEERLRTEFTNSIHVMDGKVEERATLARVQIDDLARDFVRMEARVEGTLKSALGGLRRAHYAGSAFNTLTTLSAIIILFWWLR